MEIKDILSKEEDMIFELKEEIPRNFMKHLVAFSNANGGTIVIGISDDKKSVVGIGDLGKLKAQLTSAANECYPPIKIDISTKLIDSREIVFVKVPKGNLGVYSCGGKYFIRRNDQSVPITSKEELLSLMIESGQTSYGASPVIYNKDLMEVSYSEEKVKEFMRQAKDKRKVSKFDTIYAKDVLRNLKCLITHEGEEVLSVVGLLFFVKNPQEILPHTMIKIVRFKGKDTSILIDRANLKGTLPELIEASVSFIKRNTQKKIVFKGLKRIEKTEYPIFSLREAITNAVAHRNYAIKQQYVRIFIFDDRIEIKSPGGLPPPISLDNITSAQYSREPLICRLLFHLGYMDELGSGIHRMIKATKEWGLKTPDLEEDGSDFIVKLYNEKVGEDKSILLNGSLIKSTNFPDLSPSQIDGLNFLVENGTINRTQYMKLTGSSAATATRHLTALEKMSLLKEKGYGKNIFYILNEPQ